MGYDYRKAMACRFLGRNVHEIIAIKAEVRPNKFQIHYVSTKKTQPLQFSSVPQNKNSTDHQIIAPKAPYGG